jgi:transketolase
VLLEPSVEPHGVIVATGSEVGLAVEAQKLLAQEGIPIRVVSMPSTTVFDRQDVHYRDSVLPPLVPCVAVEAGASDLWRKYVGCTGGVLGIDRFGESAPAGELFKLFGFTPERVAKAMKALLL